MEYFREVINSTKGRKGKSKPPLRGLYKDAELEEESSSPLQLPPEKIVIVSGSQLPHSNSVVDVDSYSGDAVGPQRFHRLAFFRIGRNAG
ncbi:hypothetical protein F2Q69_00005781 [Brassica cretica]|uniref:Uncharacterized protein n=1 Tax=Brassica cretica TaxID=69181 RepID=A0A8S9NLN6_BRACR|nr:hypothetical protein F2Q69_00005781 [Brassica cretica]